MVKEANAGVRISLAGGLTLDTFPFEKVILTAVKLQRALVEGMKSALAIPLLVRTTKYEEFVVYNGCRMTISFLGQDRGDLLWLLIKSHVLLLSKSTSPGTRSGSIFILRTIGTAFFTVVFVSCERGNYRLLGTVILRGGRLLA